MKWKKRRRINNEKMNRGLQLVIIFQGRSLGKLRSQASLISRDLILSTAPDQASPTDSLDLQGDVNFQPSRVQPSHPWSMTGAVKSAKAFWQFANR